MSSAVERFDSATEPTSARRFESKTELMSDLAAMPEYETDVCQLEGSWGIILTFLEVVVENRDSRSAVLGLLVFEAVG